VIYTFASPQTGSQYTVVEEFGDGSLSFRYIGDGTYRVRITCGARPHFLTTLLQDLSWPGGVKGEDHISTEADAKSLEEVLVRASQVIHSHL
jgi:hypothetical protein